MDREALTRAILELSPPRKVYDNHYLLRACMDEEMAWRKDILSRMSEWDLIKIFRIASITEEEIG